MDRIFSFKEGRTLIKQYKDLFNDFSFCYSYPVVQKSKIFSCYSDLRNSHYFENDVDCFLIDKPTEKSKKIDSYLSEIARYIKSQELIRGLKERDAEIDNYSKPLSKDLIICGDPIRWAFSSRTKKEKAIESYEALKIFYDSPVVIDAKSKINFLNSLDDLTSEESLEFFNDNKSDFKTVIEKNFEKYITNSYPTIIKKVISDYENLFLIQRNIDEDFNKIKTEIVTAIDTLIANELLKVLRQIPVEELSREKKGIRIKALRDEGITSMADIFTRSEYNISAIYGISDDVAYSIKRIGDEYAKKARKGIKIKLSVDNKDKYSSDVIRKLSFYKVLSEHYQSLKEFLFQNGKNIKHSTKQLASVKDGSLWLFEDDQYKEDTKKSYEYLKGDVFDNYSALLTNTVSLIRRASRPTIDESWEDFSKNSIIYYNLVEEIYPGVLGNDDAVYGLPEELARKIEDMCYFPDGLLCTLRKYQEWGVKYILHQENALLGDEMGLGKTVQAIAVMVSLRNTGAKHFVVVCPASVLTNWCREVTKHSKLKVFKVHGAGKINVINAWIKNGGVAVTTYESTAAFLNYPDLVINQIVVDEAHYIKNPEANRSKRTRDLCERSERVLFMTGTALENRVDEMIELISILNPRIAHQISSIAFMSTAQQFREKVAPVYYRRKRNDVLTELPDLIESKEWCTLTPEEERQYEDSVLSKNYMAARRVSWDINDISKSTKANRLLEIIEDAKNDGRKVLVFSFFLDTISKIKQLLGYKCLNPITGALNPARRQEIIDEFDKSEPGTVLLSQIQSGGTGLNIQSASVVVICEPQLKPSIENQAISRAYRMGQSRNVQVFRLLAENTIDERLIEILEEKQEIFNAFADKSVAAEKSLEIDETTFGEIIKEEIERIQKKRGESPENPRDFEENSVSDNSQYYDDLMKLSYRDLCEELLNKYGPVKGDYFVNENCRSKNQKISRSKEGLFVHHIDEDKAIMLSEPDYAIKKPFMYQRADRLLYCNLLEHYLLHIKITEESVFNIDNEELVGIGGALKLLGRQINDFYGGKIFMQEYMIHATNIIKDDFESYIKMIKYFWEVTKDHPLYSQMIKKEELALGWDGNLIQKVYNQIN